MLLSQLDFTSTQELLVLLKMSLDLSELIEQSVVLKNFNVFNVEVGLGVTLELLLRFTRVDSLEDADTSEVLEGELELTNSVGSGEVLTGLALYSLLNLLAHLYFNLINFN